MINMVSNKTTSSGSDGRIEMGEKSSNSEALARARATTLSGNLANSATCMPKL